MKRVFAHIGFSMAVTLLILNLLKANAVLIIAIVITIILIPCVLIDKIREKIAVPLCLGAALFSCLVFMLGSNSVASQLQLVDNSANASFYYVDIPTENDNGYTYIVKTVKIDNPNVPQNIKLKVRTEEKLNAQAYQVVEANLNFESIAKNAYDSYGAYSNGYYLSASAEDVNVTNFFVSSPWKWVYQLRLDIIETLTENLNGDVGALASALITGYKARLSESLYNSFKFSGMTHLIAVSGLHLTILTGILFAILRLFKTDKKLVAVIGIAFVLVISGLAGFSKSIIRAGIMLSVLLIGNASKNRADSLNSLGVAVALMCLNPFSVTDVGAQLSILSTFGILVLLNLNFKCKYRRLFNLVAIPWVVSIFTFPVMALSFGYMSLVGLVSNLISPIIGDASLVFSIASYVFLKLGFLSSIFLWLSTNTINLLIYVARLFAGFKLAVIPIDNRLIIVFLGALSLIVISLILKKRKWIKPVVLLSFVALVVTTLVTTMVGFNSAKVLVAENGSVAIAYKDEGYVLNSNKKDLYIVKTFLFANHIVLNDVPDDSKLLNNITVSESENGAFAEVNGVTFAVKDSGAKTTDVLITENEIYDSTGVIDLNNGDVVYTIKNNSSYEVNWLDYHI